MAKFIAILVLGVALFFSGAWALGLFDEVRPINTSELQEEVKVPSLKELGPDLYEAAAFQPIPPMQRSNPNPIVLHGALNAFETEEVSSPIQGKVLFIGEQVDDAASLVAGSAAFLAEPYYSAQIYTGPAIFVKFYRRIYEGDIVRRGQMLGLIEPSEALGNVLKEMAKVESAEADVEAAVAAEGEGLQRRIAAEVAYLKKAMSREDYGAAVLTHKKLIYEAVGARAKAKVAVKEKDNADIKLYQHQIRAVLPYKNSTVKAIQRPAGTFLKQLDPVVITVQNLERLMAEAQIEEQYATKLERMPNVTATIEPTILEAPSFEYPGHEADVTCVAVARDMKIVSGGEDGIVNVWKLYKEGQGRKLDHDKTAVRVLACTPKGAKDNLCVVGCDNGSIFLWNLDKDDNEPVKDPIPKAHGNERGITAIAFSPDGKYFASGATDGSIYLWTTEDFSLKYKFEPANGVRSADNHEDAVTSLTFTPQCKLISAGRDSSLRVWFLKEHGAALDGRPILNRKGNVQQLGITGDGQWMLFDQGHTLKWYSVERRTYVYTLNQPASAMPFDTLAQFSPDGTLLLTGGSTEGRLQLWRCPDEKTRGFEVRQFATREKAAVAAAAFSPEAGKAGKNSFAVSASGQRIYLWSIPTPGDVDAHRIENVPLTLKTRTLDPSTKQTRVGFEVTNPFSDQYPHGRFEAGRPVTIVID
jgi:WD40 repeat protein